MNDKDALIDWLKAIADLLREVWAWFQEIPVLVANGIAQVKGEIRTDLMIGVAVVVVTILVHGIITRRK